MAADAGPVLSKEELETVTLKREQRRQEKYAPDLSKSGKLVKICPACTKPNNPALSDCSRCHFILSEWDLDKVPVNVFLDIVNGCDSSGTVVLLRSENFVVVDDKFSMSLHHIDVIPTRHIPDLTSLSAVDLPMLESMYKLGMEVLKGRAHDGTTIGHLLGVQFEDYLTVGFNYPVSVDQLHLHMLVPPLKYQVIYNYPRWHSFRKVMSDLRSHGRVITNQELEAQSASRETEFTAEHDWTLDSQRRFESVLAKSKTAGA